MRHTDCSSQPHDAERGRASSARVPHSFQAIQDEVESELELPHSDVAVERVIRVAGLLGIPPESGWHLHGVVPMGYPTGRWGVGARTPVHEVAARNG
jgi:hypothetical protein